MYCYSRQKVESIKELEEGRREMEKAEGKRKKRKEEWRRLKGEGGRGKRNGED